MKGVGDLMSYQLPKKELYIFTHNNKKPEKPLAHTIYVEIWLKVYRKCRDSLEDITNMLNAIIMKSTNYYIPDTQFLSCFLPFQSRLNHMRR